jgi:hypothetical protein
VCGESRKHGSAGGQGILRDRLPYPACEALALGLRAAGVPERRGDLWRAGVALGALDADAAGEQAVRRRHGQDGCLVTASAAARGAKSARFNAG